MGKKKIVKETKPLKGRPKEEERDEPENVPEPSSAKKKGRKPNKGPADIAVFSESFEKRIVEFKDFYRDFLERKASSDNTDMHEEMGEVARRVSAKIEEACSAVLKDDLRQAEEWIGEQQKAVQEQIDKISSAYNETKHTLSVAGTFSESEIEKQLEMIEQKKSDLQGTYDNYDSLREQAAKIYTLHQMDE